MYSRDMILQLVANHRLQQQEHLDVGQEPKSVEVRLQEMRAKRKPYTESDLDDDLNRYEEDRAWDSFLENGPYGCGDNAIEYDYEDDCNDE